MKHRISSQSGADTLRYVGVWKHCIKIRSWKVRFLKNFFKYNVVLLILIPLNTEEKSMSDGWKRAEFEEPFWESQKRKRWDFFFFDSKRRNSDPIFTTYTQYIFLLTKKKWNYISDDKGIWLFVFGRNG